MSLRIITQLFERTSKIPAESTPVHVFVWDEKMVMQLSTDFSVSDNELKDAWVMVFQAFADIISYGRPESEAVSRIIRLVVEADTTSHNLFPMIVRCLVSLMDADLPCDPFPLLGSGVSFADFARHVASDDEDVVISVLEITKWVCEHCPSQAGEILFHFDGRTVYAGKNNLQNDILVKSSRAYDVWLHVKGTSGCHVVIKNDTAVLPPDAVILKAARIAAQNSKARLSDNVPVDYTFIKYVSKPSGSPPGKVVYTNQKTVYVRLSPVQ
jgi:hypothetical protein